VYFVDKISNNAEQKNNLIVIIELTKITVIVRTNLKWPNFDYPSFYLVGKYLTLSCDHEILYSLGAVRVLDFEIWPDIL
jgi:hypothetical protein